MKHVQEHPAVMAAAEEVAAVAEAATVAVEAAAVIVGTAVIAVVGTTDVKRSKRQNQRKGQAIACPFFLFGVTAFTR